MTPNETQCALARELDPEDFTLIDRIRLLAALYAEMATS